MYCLTPGLPVVGSVSECPRRRILHHGATARSVRQEEGELPHRVMSIAGRPARVVEALVPSGALTIGIARAARDGPLELPRAVLLLARALLRLGGAVPDRGRSRPPCRPPGRTAAAFSRHLRAKSCGQGKAVSPPLGMLLARADVSGRDGRVRWCPDTATLVKPWWRAGDALDRRVRRAPVALRRRR